MKRVVSVYLNGNNIAVYEQETETDYTYLVFSIGKKRIYLDEFDSLTEATMFALQFAMDNLFRTWF